MDTTSLYFEGAGGQTLGRGFSKDHRPDLHQMILAVLLDGDGAAGLHGDVAGQLEALRAPSSWRQPP
jgi:hypothetical protein